MGTVYMHYFAAMSGVSGAATIAMGLVSIPSGQQLQQTPGCGCVAAGGV